MEKRQSPQTSDALANERTYLAYLRTSLSFIAFGFVIARFSLFTREISLVAHITLAQSGSSLFFGVSMAIVGVFVGVAGAWRYIATDRALRRGGTNALSTRIALAGAGVVALVGVIVSVELLRLR